MAVLMAAIRQRERPRERLLSREAEVLSVRELLALVLRNGMNGMSVLDLAAALLADCGSLDALAQARPEELSVRPGVGHAKAAALVAALALGRRLTSAVDERTVLRTARGGPLCDTGYGRAWQHSRQAALTPAQCASPLARRPYDLRHAAVSLWLNAGVPATEVAHRAGHGVAVLLKVYASCIDGRTAQPTSA